MKSLNNTLVNVLLQGHTKETGKKLESYFSVKDQTNMQHQNDLIQNVLKMTVWRTMLVKLRDAYRNELMNMLAKTTNHMF